MCDGGFLGGGSVGLVAYKGALLWVLREWGVFVCLGIFCSLRERVRMCGWVNKTTDEALVGFVGFCESFSSLGTRRAGHFE